MRCQRNQERGLPSSSAARGASNALRLEEENLTPPFPQEQRDAHANGTTADHNDAIRRRHIHEEVESSLIYIYRDVGS
jgi:hypothetical protein